MKTLLSKISFSRLFFSIIFSFALFFMSKIVFLDWVYSENYMDLIFASEFKILLITIPIIYLLATLLEKHYNNIYRIIIPEKKFEKKKLFTFVAFIFLLIVYLAYFLTFFPGGVYIDTWTSLEMLTGAKEFTTQQPVLYTLMLNLVKAFLPDVYTGFGIFTFIQVMLMVISFTYFIYWLLNKGVSSQVATFITIFLGFFKLYPLYSVSLWKDTPFSLALFMYALTLIDIIINFKDEKIKISNIVKFNVYGFLIMSFRNNGLYIVVASLILLLFTFIPNIIKKEKIIHCIPFSIISTLVVIIFLIIQSIYPLIGISGTTLAEKSISIPVQQIARVVATDGNITDEQMELIEKVLPKEVIKERYRALIVDSVKWHPEFDETYLEDHKNEYLKLWFELFLQNPSEYVIAYLLQTSGFWTFNVRGQEAYASPIIWETLNSEIQNKNLIEEYTTISFRKDFVPTSYYSGGLFFWIIAISILITFRTCEKKYLIGYLPPVLLWLTVMISTPMGSALRYVYILVLILPLNFVYPAIARHIKEESENN